MASSRVECPTCKRPFPSHDSMKQHFSASHTASDQVEERKEKYGCKLCLRPFRTQQALQGHMRSFHLTLACNDCGKPNFKSAKALHQHQLASVNHTHVSKRPMNPNHGMHMLTCSQCNTTFSTAEDLEEHFAEQHPVCEVPKSRGEESTWHQVEACFQLAWMKPTSKLYKVCRVFKVYNSGWRQAEFEQYRKEVKAAMSSQKMNKEEDLELHNNILHNGNELLRYHNIIVKCRLGQPPNPKCNHNETLSLCMDMACNFCQILRNGFKKRKCQKEEFQRFGKSNCCSAASSKASPYVKCGKKNQKVRDSFKWFWSCFGNNASTGAEKNHKMMMVCRVIAGRPYHLTDSSQDLENPPYGFHSLQGDPDKTFNYDELVVYDDRAILIAYMVLYTSSN